MISITLTIIVYSFLTILALFVLGYGLAQFIIPSPLKKYAFWLIPWLGAFFLIFSLVILSFTGLTVKQVSPSVIAFSLILDIAAILGKKFKITFDLKQELIIALFIGMSIVFNTSPLVVRDRTLTSLSMGNNDIIAYVTSADYLVNHPIIEIYYTSVPETISNLLGGFYRFGPPIIGSFFINLFQLESYQFIYLFEVILFALTLPLFFIFLKIIYKGSLIVLGFLMVIATFNANLLYMLYHDFFGQTLFWGIQMFLLILLYSYIEDEKNNKVFFNRYDYLIGGSISVLYFTYHEPAFFVVAPLGLFLLISLLLKKNIISNLIKFMKIALVAILSGSISIVYSIFFDFNLAFKADPNQPIGWELFREKIPFANPFEAIGFYSIHSFSPLPSLIAILLSLLTAIVIIYGVMVSKKKLLIISYLIVYLFFYYLLGIHKPNFFIYNRALTYTLPVWLIIFSIGITHLLETLKKPLFFKVIICFLAGLVIFSGLKLNRRFIGGRLSVDESYSSLLGLKNQNINEPIYIESFVNDKIPLWKRNWMEYFIYYKNISSVPTLFNDDQHKNKVPDNSLVLLSKLNPWLPPPKIILKDIIWNNEYFQLGHICNAEECLLQSNRDLSLIEIGKNDYEDSLLIFGFDIIEGEIRWANSKESRLRLVSKNDFISNLTIEAQTLKEPQNITIYIDGKEIGSLTIKEKWSINSLPINSFFGRGVHNISLRCQSN